MASYEVCPHKVQSHVASFQGRISISQKQPLHANG